MKCPKCPNKTAFRVTVLELDAMAVTLIFDENGALEANEDYKHLQTEQTALDGECEPVCHECGHEGSLSDFDDGTLPMPVGEFQLIPENPPDKLAALVTAAQAVIVDPQLFVSRQGRGPNKRLAALQEALAHFRG